MAFVFERLKNHSRKRRKCWFSACSPFSTMFSKVIPVSADKNEIFRNGSIVNPFPNKSLFLPVCSASLLKTLWEKEKLLVTSNFSFSHSVFYPFVDFSPFTRNLKLSSANSLSLEDSKTCRGSWVSGNLNLIDIIFKNIIGCFNNLNEEPF